MIMQRGVHTAQGTANEKRLGLKSFQLKEGESKMFNKFFQKAEL